MNQLTEYEKQQVRDKVFTPAAKYIGALLFEDDVKFDKKLHVYVEKLAKNCGWVVSYNSNLEPGKIEAKITVKVRDGLFMQIDIVVTPDANSK